MGPENIVLTKVTQTQNDRHHRLSLTHRCEFSIFRLAHLIWYIVEARKLERDHQQSEGRKILRKG